MFNTTNSTSPKTKHSFWLFLMLALSIGCLEALNNTAYGTEGGGGDTSGTSANCSNNALIYLCGDNGSAGGGASWRIFKTNDGWGLDDYTGYGGAILQQGYKNQAMEECKNEGWFASFGWDGMYGSHYGYNNFNFQIGPANRNDLVGSAVYNNYNAKNLSYLEANGFPNNTKIYYETAVELYQRLHPGETDIPNKVGYFCVSPDHSLTAYAITNDGSFITDSSATDSSGKITATTTINNTEYSGYQKDVVSKTLYVAAPAKLIKDDVAYEFHNDWRYCFYKGRSDGDCNAAERAGGTGSLFQSSNPFDASYWSRIKDKSAYAIYTPNLVYGKSTAGDKTTDWQRTNKTADLYSVDNCSPTNGCKVTFEHALKRTSGNGSSTYLIKRESNYWVSTKSLGVQPRNPLKTGTENFRAGNNTDVQTNKETLTLYPGQVVCEEMTFNTSPGNSASIATTRVCASASGNAQPPSSSGSDDNTLLQIKVKNSNVSHYKEYQDEVYAKPGDHLTYQAFYNPVLQYTYSLKPQKMRIDGGTIYPTSGINESSSLGALYNNHHDANKQNWNNGFTVYGNNFTTGTFEKSYTFSNGDTTKQEKPNEHIVQAQEVGKDLLETTKTNYRDNTKTTPSQVIFSKSDSFNLSNVITAQITDSASAKIPYNFINSTYVISNDADTTFYAGESATVKMNITVNPKQNNTTKDKYATIVRNAKWKLVFCVGDTKCNANNYEYETNPNSTSQDLNANSSIEKQITINIPDVVAGTKLCVKSAVYPANSGNDKNWKDPEGSHTWAISAPVCYNVAKKPNMEVWGGNIYSRGKINTSISNKGALAGYQNYKVEGAYSSRYVFGSWGELGLIANGAVTNFSSGASLGFAANDDGTLTPDPFNGKNNNSPKASSPGGSKETSICKRSPLTFANNPCNNGVGALGGSTTINSVAEDKSAIITKYIYRGESNVTGEVTLNDESKIKNNNIYYYYNNDPDISNLNLLASVVNKNTTQVVHSTRNITINGDLTYEDGYTNYEEMPKLIIYAEGDIEINCGVKRIDAVLIAEDNVKTCSNSDDINAKENSNQLIINGAIIADSLTPNRTYGAATGANSIVPAEIINFDPNLYMWGGHRSETNDGSTNNINANLNVVYNKELVPRQ